MYSVELTFMSGMSLRTLQGLCYIVESGDMEYITREPLSAIKKNKKVSLFNDFGKKISMFMSSKTVHAVPVDPESYFNKLTAHCSSSKILNYDFFYDRDK